MHSLLDTYEECYIWTMQGFRDSYEECYIWNSHESITFGLLVYKSSKTAMKLYKGSEAVIKSSKLRLHKVSGTVIKELHLDYL